MKGALPLIVVCGVAVALVLGLSTALVLNVQGRRQMADDHAVELAAMRRTSGEQEAALVALRAELESSQAQIIALHGTLEEIRTQLSQLRPDVSSREAPSPMAPLFLRQTPGRRGERD